MPSATGMLLLISIDVEQDFCFVFDTDYYSNYLEDMDK